MQRSLDSHPNERKSRSSGTPIGFPTLTPRANNARGAPDARGPRSLGMTDSIDEAGFSASCKSRALPGDVLAVVFGRIRNSPTLPSGRVGHPFFSERERVEFFGKL